MLLEQRIQILQSLISQVLVMYFVLLIIFMLYSLQKCLSQVNIAFINDNNNRFELLMEMEIWFNNIGDHSSV